MHFLGKLARHEQRHLDGPRVAVIVKWTSRRQSALVLVGSDVGVAKDGVRIAELPKKIRVLDPDGEPVAASGRFFVTTETVDPYHLLLDIF